MALCNVMRRRVALFIMIEDRRSSPPVDLKDRSSLRSAFWERERTAARRLTSRSRVRMPVVLGEEPQVPPSILALCLAQVSGDGGGRIDSRIVMSPGKERLAVRQTISRSTSK